MSYPKVVTVGLFTIVQISDYTWEGENKDIDIDFLIVYSEADDDYTVLIYDAAEPYDETDYEDYICVDTLEKAVNFGMNWSDANAIW